MCAALFGGKDESDTSKWKKKMNKNQIYNTTKGGRKNVGMPLLTELEYVRNRNDFPYSFFIECY